MTASKPGVSVDFGWEPVFLYGGRRRNRRAPVVRDWLMCGPARHRGISHGVEAERNEGAVIGMKPQAFCYWTFDCLGARLGDTLDDLFPGSGTVTAAWQSYIRAPQLWTVDASGGEQLEMEDANAR